MLKVLLLFGVLVANYQFIKCDSSGWNNIFSNNVIPLQHFGNKSYYFSYNFQGTWLEADQFCKDIHMELVSIKSVEENDKLYKFVMEDNKQEHFWTAGSRLLDKKTWIWMTTGEVVDYTNWAPGQPDSQGELCIELWWFRNKGLQWNDRGCEVKFNFICERDKGKKYNDAGLKQESDWSKVFQDPSISPNINLLNYEGKSYYVANNFRATFLEATQFCQIIQMKLVSITSEKENTRLHKYIRDINAGDSFWSSGSRVLDGKTWIWWANGKTVEYTNWLPGQPDSQNEYCIELKQNKNDGLFWNDLGCGSQLYFICEKGTIKTPRPIGPIIDPIVKPPIYPPICNYYKPPVVNVYVTNNVISNGTIKESKKIVSSKDPALHGSCSIQVNNDIEGANCRGNGGYGGY